MTRGRDAHSPIAVLVSGGLDSAVLLAELMRTGRTVQPIYVQAGLIWERIEHYWLRRYLRRLTSASLRPLVLLALPASDLYGKHWSISGHGTPGYHASFDSNYLPGRNLLLLAKAAVFCAQQRIDTIALAVLRDNPFPDGQPKFFRSLGAAIRAGLHATIKVQAPFRRLSKAEVIRRGRDLPLHLTFSCARPIGRLHCGRCTKCAERQEAFRRARVADPTTYSAGGERGRRAAGRR